MSRALRLSLLALIPAFAVAAGAAVWRHAHVRFWWRQRTAAQADLTRWPAIEIPREPPAGWVRIDVGVASFTVPPPIRDCVAGPSDQLEVATDLCRLRFFGAERGRAMIHRPTLQRLPDGSKAPVAFLLQAVRAAAVATDDVRWGLSNSGVLELRELLDFRLRHGLTAATGLRFNGYHTMGLAYPTPAGDGRRLTIVCGPYDRRDAIALEYEGVGDAAYDVLADVIASVRFPDSAADASGLSRHVDRETLRLCALVPDR